MISCILLLQPGCRPAADADVTTNPVPALLIPSPWPDSFSRADYHDKVLGMLIGSAIGDAMGAPTEMWQRSQIKSHWGYVDRLDSVLRIASPEGPWHDNLPPGGTTDDTRWKSLLTQWFQDIPPTRDTLDGRSFARAIHQQYNAYVARSVITDSLSGSVRREDSLRQYWLSEWAQAALPYSTGDWQRYSDNLHQFYGGEMACAGMLYAPMVGAYYPADPKHAYREAYRLSLFDLGYAKDITALTAAYVSEAMNPTATLADIVQLSDRVDPHDFHKSRLIGRIAHHIYQTAEGIASEAQKSSSESEALNKAYEMLDQQLQDIPFHAAEIHLINLTAILFANGDFRKALEFVVNYGRDNDTVAAVTGAILGAYWGAKALPPKWYEQVVKVNRDQLEMDLEKMADEIVESAYRGMGRE